MNISLLLQTSDLNLVIFIIMLIIPSSASMSGKKKTNKKNTQKRKSTNDKSSTGSDVSLTKEQQIEKSISEHTQLINDIWEFICTPALTHHQRIREKLHKEHCKKLKIQYKPKSSISFNRFKSIIETMTDIQQKPKYTPNTILNNILDVFEWFDVNASGKISYKHFQQRLGQFLFEENSSKSKPKKSGKGKKKGGKKGKK